MCFKESSLLHAIQKGGSSPFNKKMSYLLMASLMIVGIEQSLFSSVGIRGVKEFVWLWIDVTQPLKSSARGNFSASPTWSIRPTTGCRARSTSLWTHRNLFWQLSRDENLYGSVMSRATTASPKSSFRALWKVGDSVVGTGNAGWTTSKSGHPCPCQNC